MASNGDIVESRSVRAQQLLSLKRTFDLFTGNFGEKIPLDEESQRVRIAAKVGDEFAAVKNLPDPQHRRAATKSIVDVRPQGPTAEPMPGAPLPKATSRRTTDADTAAVDRLIDSAAAADTSAGSDPSTAIVAASRKKLVEPPRALVPSALGAPKEYRPSSEIAARLPSQWPKPQWRAPWKMYRVISGHLGWVRSVAFDPGNAWFVTGSADRTIKVWDTATGQLKLTLTGHTEQVTGLAISSKSPYMFSCGLDKMVKCWDLEQNKVIRSYHGHLSGVYCLALHPELDILFTGGRDSCCRVWDMRTKVQVHCLTGHDDTVGAVLAQPTDPQVITGSQDTMIKLWDLRKGSAMTTLTFHKKGVRALAAHPREWAFASAASDNIKKFKLPEGRFLHNGLQQQPGILNTLALNEDGVMASGGDNGSLWFWDWASGHPFQKTETRVQPGSLESEAAIYAAAFDMTGSRLVTCEGDKTVKMWKEVEDATPDAYPGEEFLPPDAKTLGRF
ncbi:unnamed protein product [Pedinophyceae sp. YPF-701]|nr:unnamed protein product [Pedinophyceae sp. YPF-701]